MSDSKSLSKERFSQFADRYVSSRNHAAGDDLTDLVEISGAQPDWTVLDIATGGGHTALAVAPYVAQVTASDLAPRMLKKAEAHILGQEISNVVFCVADAENLPFTAACFDLVTCRIAPHHFPDCARFIREARRVVKPGGKVVVQDHLLPDDEVTGHYIDDFERLRDPSHNRSYSRMQWVNMFEATGLTVTHTRELTKRHNLVRWAERQGAMPALTDKLHSLLMEAPPSAAAWMEIQDPGTTDASFAGHQLLIAATRPI